MPAQISDFLTWTCSLGFDHVTRCSLLRDTHSPHFFFFFQLLQPWCKESLSLQKSSAAPRLPSLQTFKNNHDSMNVKLLTPRLPLGKFRLSTDSVLYHHSSYPPPDHHHQKKNSMCFLQQWGKLIPYWGGEPTKYKSSVVKNKTLCRVVQSQAKDFYLI